MTRPGCRVSIGLPVYNGEKYLEQAIQSLLAQTFTDFELVICDNASTDRTEEICRAYAALDDRIRYYRNPENRGAAYNYNRSFELSTGDYFRWAACDDLCSPELVERCVAVLDDCPSVVLCYPKTMVIDAGGGVVGRQEDELALLDDDPVKRHKAFHRRFRKNQWCNPVFGVVRAEALRKTRLHGNYNSADVILLEELTLQGLVYEVPEYLFYRRIHPLTSTNANATPQAIAIWFDPGNRGRTVTPYWRLICEHFRVVRNASLSQRDKILCYSHLMGWFVWWRRGLAREALGLLGARLLRGRPQMGIRG